MKFVKNNYKVKKGLFELILSYLSLIFIIGIPWLIFAIPLIYRLTNGKTIRLGFAIVGLSLTFIIIAIVLAIPKKLKLTRIGDTEYEGLIDRIICCCKELNWSYSQISENEFKASTPISWYSWGEEIYIIYINNEVFINSMGKTSPITFGKDKKNMELFKSLFLEC